MTDAQPQVPQSLGLAEVVVSTQATVIQITLQWFDQSIQPWIQDRTTTEVDDAMGSPPEVAHTKAAVLASPEGDEPAVSVAEPALIGQGSSLEMVNSPDPQHRLVKLMLLPITLC